MESSIVVTGMVLAAASVGEYDKRLVILTKERGKISAFAKGAKRQNSPLLAGSKPFSFGNFRLYEGRSSYTVCSMEILNYFMELSMDLEGACYGFYFLEFAEYYTSENVDESEMIKLLYQSLRALSKESIQKALIRRIFELKAFTINGEYPDMYACTSCRGTEELLGYSAKKKGAVCRKCRGSEENIMELAESTVYTMQYVIAADFNRLYTFKVSEQVLNEFSMVMNRYLAAVMDKKMKSLEVLNEI